jgi:hypothetical protein
LLFLKLLFLVFSIGWIGWAAIGNKLAFSKQTLRFRDAFSIFLFGFGLFSAYLFFLAVCSAFTFKNIVYFWIFLLLVYCLKLFSDKNGIPWRKVCQYILYLALLTGFVFGLAKTLKPWQMVIGGSDASVYTGAAYQLARGGALIYQDALASEMTREEREVFFKNRFGRDATGKYVRFPGGIKLKDGRAAVIFGFYHLFPAWLGFALLFLGSANFLYVLSLFLALGILALYFLGESGGGRVVGIFLPIFAFSFLPQTVALLKPMSESLAFPLFFCGLWIFLRKMCSETSMTREEQLLIGFLWGNLFLVRVENILFIPVCLLLIYGMIPLFRRTWRKDLFLFGILGCFWSFALLYQWYRKAYGIEIAYFFEKAIDLLSYWRQFPLLPLGAVFCLSGLIFWRYKRRLAVDGVQREKGKWSASVIALVVEVVCLMFLYSFFPDFLSWFLFKIGDKLIFWLLVICSFGFFLVCTRVFLFREKREWGQPILIFFLIAAILFSSGKIFGFRVLSPFVCPLFLILCLSGWSVEIKSISARYRLEPLRLFLVIFGLLGVFFICKSSLFWQGIPDNKLVSQLSSLAEKIPERAIVFIPDAAAGLHVQTALSYMGQKDVLLLPASLSGDKDSVVISYIRRQQKRGRPVLMLIFGVSKAVSYLPLLRFSPVFFEKGAVDIPIFSAYARYENRPHKKDFPLPYAIFSLKEYTGTINVPYITSIDIGDISQDCRYWMNGMYAPERNEFGFYRWTNGMANLYLPSVSQVTLVVRGGRPPGMQKVWVKCALYNGEVIYEGILGNREQRIVVTIPSWIRQMNKPFNLLLLSNVFYPEQAGASNDGRKLGIQLYRVELKP